MSFTINIRAGNDATIPTMSTIFNIDKQRKLENFLINIEKEVKALSKKRKRKLKQQISAIVTGLLLTFNTTNVFAAGNNLISPDMVSLMMGLVGMCVLLGVLLAMICLVLAGIQTIFNQIETARMWTQNIIKGLGQVMLAPMIVITIVILGSLLFAGNPYYINPLKFIPTFGN